MSPSGCAAYSGHEFSTQDDDGVCAEHDAKAAPLMVRQYSVSDLRTPSGLDSPHKAGKPRSRSWQLPPRLDIPPPPAANSEPMLVVPDPSCYLDEAALTAQLLAETDARTQAEEEVYVLKLNVLQLQESAQSAKLEAQQLRSSRDSLLAENRLLQELLYEANEEHQAAEAELKRVLNELEQRSAVAVSVTGSTDLEPQCSSATSALWSAPASSLPCSLAFSADSACSSATQDAGVQVDLQDLAPSSANNHEATIGSSSQACLAEPADTPPISASTSTAAGASSSAVSCPAAVAPSPTAEPQPGPAPAPQAEPDEPLGPSTPTRASEGASEGPGPAEDSGVAALKAELERMADLLVAKSLELAQLREQQERDRRDRLMLETVNLRLMKKVERMSEYMP